MILHTSRLILRKFDLLDAPFVLKLVNGPSWLEYIGDKGVRNIDDASNYILNGPIAMYKKHGFGLFLTELKDGTPIGMCGLIKRDTLDDVDIGFAFMPEFWKKGYAAEATAATLEFGFNTLNLERIVAIVSPNNEKSINLLQKIGLKAIDTIRLTPESNKVILLEKIKDSHLKTE